jgi:hypothetical protein
MFIILGERRKEGGRRSWEKGEGRARKMVLSLVRQFLRAVWKPWVLNAKNGFFYHARGEQREEGKRRRVEGERKRGMREEWERKGDSEMERGREERAVKEEEEWREGGMES